MVKKKYLNNLKNKKIFITGHSGFKGTWMVLWLLKYTKKIYGFSLNNVNFEHYKKLNLRIKNKNANLLNSNILEKKLKEFDPEIIIHLAAQPIVSKAFEDPLETFKNNIIGTANLLQKSMYLKKLKVIAIITSDKVYKNYEKKIYFNEKNELGGDEPYGVSKASAELVCDAYRTLYKINRKQKKLNHVSIITLRGGNVIGGGDFSKDRLFSDIYKSLKNKTTLLIRNPNSTRPWQHVLECIKGYLMIIGYTLEKNNNDSWNIGPKKENNIKVRDIINFVKEFFPQIKFKINNSKKFKESKNLMLSSSKIIKKISFKSSLSTKEQIVMTLEWYKEYFQNKKIISKKQLDIYFDLLND